MAAIPAKTGLSDAICKQLAKEGLKFLGSTTIYAYLQSCGFVNDHLADCPQYSACRKLARCPKVLLDAIAKAREKVTSDNYVAPSPDCGVVLPANVSKVQHLSAHPATKKRPATAPNKLGEAKKLKTEQK